MSKLQENIDNFFKKKSGKADLTEELLHKLIMEELGLGPIEEKEAPNQGSVSVAWEGIPFLSPNEIAWGTVSTKKGANPSDSRKQIERFLTQIGAKRYDIKSKLKYLEAFFSKSEKTGEMKSDLKAAGIDLDDPKQSIAKILSYLTFYKTLTMILQNFNAASAGFTFESFVAVLLGGKQVPTGNATIADLTTKTGKPISLKLLDEGSASVEGSLRDLINDFAGLGAVPVERMRYIVVLKDLQGEGADLSGVIKFYQFDYTIDTILHYLTIPTGQQEHNLRLPVSVIQGQEEDELAPAKSFEDLWAENFDEALEQAKEAVPPPEGGWPEQTRDAVLSGFDESGKLVSRGREVRKKAIPNPSDIARLNRAGNPVLDDLSPYVDLQDAVYRSIYDMATTGQAEFKKAAGEREAFGREKGNYASREESLEYLKSLQSDPEAFWKTMTKTFGYAAEKQWSLSRTAIQKVPTEDSEKAYLGRLFVGREIIAEMVNLCSDTINDKIFEIFRDLRALTDNLQSYFTEGMQNETANKAIEASDSIGEKTAKVAEETSEEV